MTKALFQPLGRLVIGASLLFPSFTTADCSSELEAVVGGQLSEAQIESLVNRDQLLEARDQISLSQDLLNMSPEDPSYLTDLTDLLAKLKIENLDLIYSQDRVLYKKFIQDLQKLSKTLRTSLLAHPSNYRNPVSNLRKVWSNLEALSHSAGEGRRQFSPRQIWGEPIEDLHIIYISLSGIDIDFGAEQNRLRDGDARYNHELRRQQIFASGAEVFQSLDLFQALQRLQSSDPEIYSLSKKLIIEYTENYLRVRAFWFQYFSNFETDALFGAMNKITQTIEKLETILQFYAIELNDKDFMPENIRLWPWPSERSFGQEQQLPD